ncbi:MAG: cytochrome c3 family protein [Candidatus Brocadiia bacterium]
MPSARGVAAAIGPAALVAAALVLAACRPAGEAQPPPEARAARAAKANYRCYECHIDFKGEELTTVHQRAGVTCVRCHGHSQPHIDDEVRATPADAVFRGKAMRVFCLTCHEPSDHGEVPAHAAEAMEAEPSKRRSCTECHGDHELIQLGAARPR